MIVDFHTHSKEISLCSGVGITEIIDYKKSVGFDGAVITNHCQPWYYNIPEHSERIKRHVDVFEFGYEYAKSKDFNLFLGIEVTIKDPVYRDFLLYGVTKEILLNSPCLHSLTQKELFDFCNENNIVMIQAHPFRAEGMLSDLRYLHGIEINCQPTDINYYNDVVALAKDNNFIVTCGNDFHGADGAIVGKMIIDDDCKTSVDIANALKHKKTQMKIGNRSLEFDFHLNK